MNLQTSLGFISVLHFLHHWEYNGVISVFFYSKALQIIQKVGVRNNLECRSSEKPRSPWRPPPLITQTGLDSLAGQIKGKHRENVFPSDRLWRDPVVGFHYVGTLCDHWSSLWKNIGATAGVFASWSVQNWDPVKICSGLWSICCLEYLHSDWHKAHVGQ